MKNSRKKIQDFYLADEDFTFQHIKQNHGEIKVDFKQAALIGEQLIQNIRKASQKNIFDAFWQEYSLSGKEGIELMGLAEAMLRTPDSHNQDALIQDKINHSAWKAHLGKSPSFFVNTASLGLFTTHKFLQLKTEKKNSPIAHIKDLTAKISQPAIRIAVKNAMQMMGKQFVLGQNIKKALKEAQKMEAKGWRYSFDMLGEGARCQTDATAYYQTYLEGIHHIGKQAKTGEDVTKNHGVSVKISAIYPRFEHKQKNQALPEILDLLTPLCLLAKKYNIGLNIDAEEADRLELTLDIVQGLLENKALNGWDGLGFVMQSYQKRCPFVIDWLYKVAKENNKKIMVRLVKGAYWDSEIKHYQEMGERSYPVWTRKETSDVAYLLCAQKLIEKSDVFFPQFATHNAASVAQIISMLKGKNIDCEFQRLHGMGAELHEQIIKEHHIPSRIYAPVGSYEHLLSYLIRRLLENSANSSFVHLVNNLDISTDSLLQNPLEKVEKHKKIANEKIILPQDIYGEKRLNSKGFDLSDETILKQIDAHIARPLHIKAHSLIADDIKEEASFQDVLAPFDYFLKLGEKAYISDKEIKSTYVLAQEGFKDWQKTPLELRQQLLLKTADMIEENWLDYVNLCLYEAGKMRQDAIAEIREAVDFCRYYALKAGEIEPENTGQGVWVCISPWNFPLAIFIGQIAAALVTGNSVIAKPAEQTSLIAYYTVQKMHALGFPKKVLQLVLGEGAIGGALTSLPHLAGVAFTGSTEVARLIQKSLSQHSPQASLIAETGGQNAMIVDSTALPEQVVDDVIASSFQSAGQRCSSARILCVQKEAYDKIVTLLKGAMAELKMTSPLNLSCDLSSVIDKEAQSKLQNYIEEKSNQFKKLYQLPLRDEHKKGYYVAPTLFELKDLSDLQDEQFGPILHVMPYDIKEQDMLIQKIHGLGYGLTAGIHSRISANQEILSQSLKIGNIYINRNQIGAIVGMQPFGGLGLSGTGPKAGGPFYLRRFTQTETLKHPDLDYIFTDKTLQKTAPQNSLPWKKPALNSVILQWHEQVKFLALPLAQEEKLNNFLKILEESWLTDFIKEEKLPAITGEENYLSHLPQGIIAIDNSNNNLTSLLAILAALSTGNKVLTLKPLLQSWYNFLHINHHLPLDTCTDLQEETFDILLSSKDDLPQYGKKMAEKKGKIVSVYDYDSLFYQKENQWKLNKDIFAALTVEKTISCDRARTVGNTDLMRL